MTLAAPAPLWFQLNYWMIPAALVGGLVLALRGARAFARWRKRRR